MARRSTYLAAFAPVVLFLAAMVSADGGTMTPQPSAEPAAPVQIADSSVRSVAARPAERVQFVSGHSCRDSQSCYDAQLRRLQEAAYY